MSHVSGPRGEEGEILRLYEGQDYFIEIASIIRGQLILLVNLPSNLRGENSVGVAMLTLTEVDGRSLVSNFMSRQFVWSSDEPDPLRETRETEEFAESRRVAWEDRFLYRLRALAEGTAEAD